MLQFADGATRLGDKAGFRFAGAVSAPWTPADITGLALFLQYDSTHCSPAVAGTPVDSVSASYGTTRTAAQTLLLRPTFRADGLEYDGSAVQFMNLSSSLALPGAFTSYHVFNSPAGADIVAAGSVLGHAFVGIASTGYLIIDDADEVVNVGTPTGLLLIRLSADGAGNLSFQATGEGQSSTPGFGTFTFDSIGASGGNTIFSGSTANRSLCDIIKTGDNTGTQENTDILAWILATYGASL